MSKKRKRRRVPPTLRIPSDADQRSGLMPITHSERYRLVIPGASSRFSQVVKLHDKQPRIG